MNPQQTIDFALQFTGPLSPWWLLLALPLVLLAAYWMYRRELPAIERPHRLPLLLLRLAMLAIIVLLVFQPQLVRRLTLVFGGRTVFVLDDSRSMAARDSRFSDAAALRLARSLQTDGPADTEADPLVVLTRQITDARAEIRQFQRFSAEADRESDAFWNRVDQTQTALEETFTEAARLVDATAQLADGLNEEIAALREALTTAREATPGLFAGGPTAPPTERFDEVVARYDAVFASATEAQAAFDRLRIAQDDEAGTDDAEARADLARSIRSTERIDLVRQRLAAMDRADGYELTLLSDGRGLDWPDADGEGPAVPAEASRTDLIGAVDRIVESPSDFPLQSIVLLTDGRDTVGRPAAPVIAKLARSGVPIIGAGAGAVDEPIDLAITDVVAAPVGVVGRPMTIQVNIKSAPAERTTRKLSLLNADDQVLQEKQIDLAPGENLQTTLKLTAEEPGLQRLTISVERAANEAFPMANNQADLVVNVLEQPFRVLMLDHRPRWQTRFILNILKRLPYVDLNAILLTTQPDGELRRGVERGMWPEDASALGTYDMVILGDLPDGTLTVAEREAVDRLVAEQGKTLLTVGPTREQPLDRLAHIAVTDVGALHPVTRPLVEPLAQREAEGLATLLVDARDGAPILQCRFDGQGQRIELNSDRLWKPLNPGHLAAHTRMFVELFTWALETGRYTDEDADSEANDAADGTATGDIEAAAGDEPAPTTAPTLILNQRRAEAGEPLLIGVAGAAPGEQVIAFSGDQTIAEAEVVDGAARFDGLPVGAVSFRFADREAPVTPEVQVVERGAELDMLARDTQWLASISGATGGRSGELADIDRLLADVEPRQRVERNETIYRLWDATLLMVLLVVGLTTEWVWRKLTGLV